MQQLTEFISNNIGLFIALAVILAMIAYTETKRLTRAYKDVAPAEAVRLMNREDALVVDIRESSELGKSQIAGAKHIPFSSLKQRMAELDKYRQRAIITYCKSGMRSAMAADLLSKNQFQHVYSLKGGMSAWEGEGLPTAKS